MNEPLLVANLVAAGLLTGLIWTVQLVGYPLYAEVPAEGFVAFHAAWASRITLLVGPLMLAELLLAAAWALRRPSPLSLGALACVLVAWAVTAGLSVPAHAQLDAGFSAAAFHRLLTTNWLRTVAWTLRLGLVAWASAGQGAQQVVP